MKIKTDLIAWLLTVVLLVICGQFYLENKKIHRENLILESSLSSERQRIIDLEKNLSKQLEATKVAENEAVQLLQAIQGAPQVVAITKQEADNRLKNAVELIKSGLNDSEALRDLKWCLTEGAAHFPKASSTRSLVLSLVAKLGERRPEAVAFLQGLRDATKQEVLNSSNDAQAARELVTLNRYLTDERNTLALHDQLSLDDSRRKSLAYGAFNELVQARRYEEAYEGRSYRQMSAALEYGISARENNSFAGSSQAHDRSIVDTTARNIEVLIGIGENESAQLLANRLYSIYKTPDVEKAIRTAAQRAGKADFVFNK